MKYVYDAITPDSPLIIRVAGLPMETLLPLRFNKTMQLIDALFAKEHWLQAQAEQLSEALYQAIGTIEEKKIKYHLMALRRTIFHVQMPKPLGDHVWAALPSELAQTIRVWIGEMAQLQALHERGLPTLEAEWLEMRDTLQHLTQVESFQQGLVLASKDLYEDAVRWLQDGPASSPRRDRQLELGLLTYLSRMATKTSPFSTFMSSTRGSWVDEGPVLTCATPWQRRSAVDLNWSIAQRMASEIARWPELRATLPLRINSSLTESSSHLSFLGWKSSATKSGETVMTLANSPIIQHILQMMREIEHPTYAALLQEAARFYAQRPEIDIQRGLNQLIEIGLLELDCAIPDLATDYLGQVLACLQAGQSQRCAELALFLQKVHTYLQEYTLAQKAEERYKKRDLIYATLDSIYQYLGLSGRKITIPINNAFYENTLLVDGEMRCSLASCQDVLHDLEVLQSLSALYDQHLPGRLALTAFFADHYGEGASVSLLRFYEDFCREQAQPGGWRPGYQVSGAHLGQLFADAAFLPSETFAPLEHLRRLQHACFQRFIEPATTAWPLARLDAEAVREFVADFPAFLTPPESLAFYGQMLISTEHPQFVLNAMRSGFGRSAAQMQFLEAQAATDAHLQNTSPAYQERQPLWADLLGVFGSNASLHIAHTPYEITYPGTISSRPINEQIPLNDLTVVHNPHNKRLQLMSQRLQQEVRPVHLGMLDDAGQPPLYRFLLHTFSSGAVNAFLPMIQLPNNIAFDATLPVQKIARLYLGELVLRRATWLVGVQHLPQREKGTSSFEYMLKVQRWLREQQIPQECFVRIPAAASKDRKPLYIDFHNYLSMMIFEQMVSHIQQIAQTAEQILLLQEVLPGRDDLVLSDGHASYVSEWIIERTCTEGA